MGHPFKEEIIYIEKIANKQHPIGTKMGYRFKNDIERDMCRIALNTLIKAHKSDRYYRAIATSEIRLVSMFIPLEIDDGHEVGLKLTVQSTKSPFGEFITIESTRMIG